MKRLFKRLSHLGKPVLCFVLAAALVTCTLNAGLLAVEARAEERTYDIGVNAESVTATLSYDGLLTVSGSGQIRDFTPETAPFAEEDIREIKLGADITAIGDYTFYNCGGITGNISLPRGLIRIGDGAFSGDSEETAPKPAFVDNPFVQGLVTRRNEPASQPESEDPAESQPAPEETAEPEETSGEATLEGSASEKASSGPKEETSQPENAPETSEETPAPDDPPAESSEQGEPSAPAEEPVPTEPETPAQEDPYTVETITQQEIGTEIFYPRADAPAFTCSPENETFRAAMTAAGYVEAEQVLAVPFDAGGGSSTGDGVLVKELPVVAGNLTLPGLFPEFSAPDGGGLYSYSFGGWTEAEDPADHCREPGSLFPVEGRDDLYFYANWQQELLLGVVVEQWGDEVVFSIPDLDGYTLTSFLWQTCKLPEGESMPESPEEQEDLPWEDIPGETDQAYCRRIDDDMEGRLFRCLVTVKKRQNFLFAMFAAAGDEQVATGPVQYSLVNEQTVVLQAGSYPGATIAGGTVTLPVNGDGYAVAPECDFTVEAHPTNPIVFCGWKDSADNHYDPGDLVPGNTTLTAKWEEANIYYINGATSFLSNRNDGRTTGNAIPLAKAFYLLDKDDTGDPRTAIYRNRLVLYSGNVTAMEDFSKGSEYGRQASTAYPSIAFTVTTVTPTGQNYGRTLTFSSAGMFLHSDTRFENITLAIGSGTNYRRDTIFAKAKKCVFGKNVTSGALNIYAGDNSAAMNSDGYIRLFSGTFTTIYGGGNTQSLNANTEIVVAGDASVTGSVYGGGNAAALSGSSSVTIAGSATVGGSVYGGGESGGAGGCTVEIRGGRVTGDVFGGGNNGQVTGNTVVSLLGGEVAGNAYGGGNQNSVSGAAGVNVYDGEVKTSVYGGGNNGTVGSDTSVTLYGGTVDHSVYGGGNSAAVSGTTSVTIYDGVLGEDVFGGGKGVNAGSAGAQVILENGSVAGSVYGGGDNGTVSAGTSVEISGGTVGGNAYGGSRGAENNSTAGAVTANATLTVTGGVFGTFTGDECQPGTGSVFGGGEYARTGGTSAVEISTADNAVPTVVGGSVYGGGSQAPVTGKSSVALQSGAVAGSVYGGGFGTGASSGGGEVAMTGGAVGGSVYGGGDSGSVSGDTAVTISDGTVAVAVFGGSKGVENAPATGAVSGNSTVSLTGGVLGTYDGNAGGAYVIGTGDVYGGGEYARVSGDASVTVNAVVEGERRTVGDSAYGGGSQAPVGGKSSVQLKKGTIGGSVYGGGLGLSASSGSTEVIIEDGTVSVNVYGGGSQGTVSTSTSVEISGGTMLNVFAAGEGSEDGGIDAGRVSGSAEVLLSGGEVSGNVFGGGDLGVVGTGSDITTDRSVVTGSTKVTVTGGAMGGVFGGGSGKADTSYGTTFGNTEVIVGGGQIARDVYGGSSYAYVTGKTNVTVQAQTEQVVIHGSIFGGGKLGRSPEQGYDENAFLVFGGSELTIDGSGLSGGNRGVVLDGAILGSGNLTRVAGQRTINIRHYDDILTSLQRADLVTISDCRMTLKGEDDVSDDQGTKLFSITQVGDLHLNDTVLYLQSELREVGALGNYDDGGSPAATATSVIQAIPGLLVQIRATQTVDNVETMAYGPISGVFGLQIMKASEDDDMGVRVEGSLDSPAGAFVRVPEQSEIEFTTNVITGSHRYWRLGSAVLGRKLTLAAPKVENGGPAAVTGFVELPTSTSVTVYQITEVQQEGRFHLVLPTENGSDMTLPEGVNKNSTFALRAEPTGSGWSDTSDRSGVYALTAEPAGGWTSGVEGIWKRGSGDLRTKPTGENGTVTFTLAYDGGYENFMGGDVIFTFQETLPGQEEILNTVVVTVTLEGDRSGASQTAAVARGRSFNWITEEPDPEPDPEADPYEASISISPSGAVTAAFLTEYFPITTGAGSMYLCLYETDLPGGPLLTALPAGTRVVLADMSNERYQYYYCLADGSEKLQLSAFGGLGSGSAGYPGPTDATSRLSEALLFAVDFSGVTEGQLPEGRYCLNLLHSEEETPDALAKANFAVTGAETYSLSARKVETADTDLWTVAFTAAVPEEDTRYANGACLHVSLTAQIDGQPHSVGFPDAVEVTGGENVLRDRNGTISLTLPINTETPVTFSFSKVKASMMAPGSYNLSAVMVPRAGLQVSSDKGLRDDECDPLLFTLVREGQAETRSINVVVADGSTRLVDVTDNADLDLEVAYRNLQENDQLVVEVQHKTGTTSREESYTAVENPGAWKIGTVTGSGEGQTFAEVASVTAGEAGQERAVYPLLTQGSSGSGDGSLKLRVRVPESLQGSEQPTYRVLVKVLSVNDDMDKADDYVAKFPYNFIVK